MEGPTLAHNQNTGMPPLPDASDIYIRNHIYIRIYNALPAHMHVTPYLVKNKHTEVFSLSVNAYGLW